MLGHFVCHLRLLCGSFLGTGIGGRFPWGNVLYFSCSGIGFSSALLLGRQRSGEAHAIDGRAPLNTDFTVYHTSGFFHFLVIVLAKPLNDLLSNSLRWCMACLYGNGGLFLVSVNYFQHLAVPLSVYPRPNICMAPLLQIRNILLFTCYFLLMGFPQNGYRRGCVGRYF